MPLRAADSNIMAISNLSHVITSDRTQKKNNHLVCDSQPRSPFRSDGSVAACRFCPSYSVKTAFFGRIVIKQNGFVLLQ